MKTKLTAEEILFRLNSAQDGEGVDEDMQDEMDGMGSFSLELLDEYPHFQICESLNLGTIERVQCEFHENEACEIILHFVDHGVYFRQTGHYTSYNGSDWNKKIVEVFPKPVTVIQYFPKDTK